MIAPFVSRALLALSLLDETSTNPETSVPAQPRSERVNTSGSKRVNPTTTFDPHAAARVVDRVPENLRAATIAIASARQATPQTPAPLPTIVETSPGQSATGQTLTLAEVLASVNRDYPPLLAALQEKPLAEADVLSSLGRFDLILRARGDVEDLGPFYDDRRLDTSIEQATPLWGLSYFSGYRYSNGTFAPYDGKLETATGGEYRAGLRVPLARDRAIDFRRADLAKARIGRRLADLSIDQQRIVIVQAATRRYWDWVAAGRRLAVADSILRIAEQRDAFLQEAVKQGALPAIDVTDNQRVILQRRGFMVESRRALEQATIELSLFYRDAVGDTQLVAPDRLPPAFPAAMAIDDSKIRRDIETAVVRRPEIGRLTAQRDRTDIDRTLAINQKYPGVDFLFSYARQLGTSNIKRGPDELRWAINFDLPVQRRQARGREQSADAQLVQIDQRTRFARDQIAAEVRDAVSAVRAAYDRARVLGEEVEKTKDVEDAERTRYELGDSNLFTLNLREVATADAEVRQLTALADYYRAVALYELAIAQALAPRP